MDGIKVNRHGVELGVLAGIGDLLIFQHFMPPIGDIKAADTQFDPVIESSERSALIVGAAWSAGVAIFAKSWETFLVSGAILIALDFSYKHANALHPATGTLTSPIGTAMDFHPLPDYAMAGSAESA